jgi:hypothetical protein
MRTPQPMNPLPELSADQRDSLWQIQQQIEKATQGGRIYTGCVNNAHQRMEDLTAELGLTDHFLLRALEGCRAALARTLTASGPMDAPILQSAEFEGSLWARQAWDVLWCLLGLEDSARWDPIFGGE